MYSSLCHYVITFADKSGEDDIPEEGENEVESDCESKEQEQPEDTSEDNTET